MPASQGVLAHRVANPAQAQRAIATEAGEVAGTDTRKAPLGAAQDRRERRAGEGVEGMRPSPAVLGARSGDPKRIAGIPF